MSTPYDLYLRFLITTGVGDADDIASLLKDLNLPGEGPYLSKALKEQEAVVCQVLPESIWGQIKSRRYSADFMGYMAILEVDEFWYFEKAFRDKNATLRSAVKLTYDINQDPQLRLTVSALLMKGMPPQELAALLSSRFASFLREIHVTLFEKYFYNVRRMTRGDWQRYLEFCDPHEQKILFTALSEPLDVLKTELELPAKVSASETLQYLLTKSYLKCKEALAISTPEANKEARDWIGTITQLVDKYEKYRAGDASDFSSALQLEFNFVEGDFETPDAEVLAEITAKLKKEADDQEASMRGEV
jgi:hypothetical protein